MKAEQIVRKFEFVKNYEMHKQEKYSEFLICSNCDEKNFEQATFYCRDCCRGKISNETLSESNSFYFCTGCSLLHTRIKKFRGHNLCPIFDENSNKTVFLRSQWIMAFSSLLGSVFDSFVESYLFAHDKIEDYLDWHDHNMASTLVVVLFFVGYFALMKALFGRIATLIQIIALIFVNRLVTSNRKPLKRPLKVPETGQSFKIPTHLKEKFKLFSSNHSKPINKYRVEDSLEDNPPNGNLFWDEPIRNKDSVSSKLRPRTLYTGAQRFTSKQL